MCGARQASPQVYRGCGWIGAVTAPINRGAQLAHILANLLGVRAGFTNAVNFSEVALPSLRGADRRRLSRPQSYERIRLR